MPVFGQPAIAHFPMPENILEEVEGMFDERSDGGFGLEWQSQGQRVVSGTRSWLTKKHNGVNITTKRFKEAMTLH